MVGKDLLIAVGGVIVAAQRSCTLNMDVDTIEVCSPVDGAWKKHIPTTIGWQVQCAGLIYNPEHADALIEAISKREMVRISFYDPELRMLRSGYAIMTTLEEGGSIGDMASQSMQFLGSGELEKVRLKEMSAKRDMLVEDRSFDGDNHEIVHLQDGIKLFEYKIDTPSRISVSSDGDVICGVLIRATMDEANEILQNEDNIRMWNSELGHLSDDVEGMGTYFNVLVEPGTYCWCVNADGDYGLVEVKSIPVN